MTETLTAEELVALVQRVFAPRATDRSLLVLVDLPDDATPDHDEWRARRQIAADWAGTLASRESELGLPTSLYVYRNVRANNAQLPETAWLHAGGPLPPDADALPSQDAVPLAELLGAGVLAIAPTEFSATAPLKLVARETGLRAATMPGFSEAMIPALRLDYGEINRRVDLLKVLLDRASAADFTFAVDEGKTHRLRLDLRHRTAHASGGLLRDPGVAGNLPSGETYIVPYEGERPGDPSGSDGELPVQFGDAVVLYQIRENKAVAVTGEEPAATRERERLAAEPAYGNLAELGLGVLDDFGLEPIGSTLLDEKLAPHIAFGRSDHFGGAVGPSDFSRPEAVVHIDRVYQRKMQPRIRIRQLTLRFTGGVSQELVRDDRYVIDFATPPEPH